MKSSKIEEYQDSGIYIVFRNKMCKCQSIKLEESKVFVSEKEQGEENQCVLSRAEISVERAENQVINEQKT